MRAFHFISMRSDPMIRFDPEWKLAFAASVIIQLIDFIDLTLLKTVLFHQGIYKN